MLYPRFVTPWLIVILFLLCGYSYVKFFTYSNTQASIVKDIKQSLLEEDIFEKRKHDLIASCNDEMDTTSDGYGFLAYNKELLNHLLVDHAHRVIYCYVPKVACTNWKRVLLLLSEKSDYTKLQEIPSDSVHREGVFTKLSNLEPSQIVKALRTYNKFVFVRDPMERLVSAFRNKFEGNYKSSAYFKARFGVKILKMYRPNEFSESGDGVKFSEFVQYLIDTDEKQSSKLNEHWAPYARLCHPCRVRYNLIGKYDSLSLDAEYILRKIGAPDSLQFPKVKPSKTSTLVEFYMKQLSPEQLTGLYKIYEADFNNFNYKFNSYNGSSPSTYFNGDKS